MRRTFAHVSDLHLGRDPQTDAAVARVVDALLEADVDAVLFTGDLTEHGRLSELAAFERLVAPLRDRVVVVPGNHDRLGEDAARGLMGDVRVTACALPGLHVVRLDSTAPHNRGLLSCHGALSPADVAAVDSAVDAAPPGALVVLMLHHHLLPLPADHLPERLANLLGLPNAAELRLGKVLLERLRGRCDVVAHGHRHAPSALELPPRAGRPLRVMNAGSTPEVGRVRLLAHERGRVVAETWLEVGERRARPARPAAGCFPVSASAGA